MTVIQPPLVLGRTATVPPALDPEISAMCDGLDPCADAAAMWAEAERCGWIPREQHYERLAHMRLMADIREATGYQACERKERTVRHLGYSEGAVNAPHRETRAEKIRREDIALGLIPVK